jgi:D-beta-D-heptose 7-phosphate kinase / D-beta-D-heptose 1-phosphate adenosyltransferase
MRKMQTQLTKVLRKFSGQTIAVLGDFMLDELLRGDATRISPEAPVPVVLMDAHSRREFFPGGAGNVAANIQALGGRAIPFGAIGMDETGKQLSDELQARGIPCGTLLQEQGRITPRKLRIAAHQHQLLRLDFEEPAPITAKTSALLGRSFARWAPKLSALIISDYRKGSVQNELCNQVVALARQRRIPVFVDPKPEHPEICRHATAVTANLHEAELMAGRPMRDRASLETAGRQLLAVLDCSYLLITRDAEGMTLFEKSGTAHEIAGSERPAYDIAGIQDTVLAVLALAFCSGAEMSEAAELANLAARQAAWKFGTSEVGGKELLKAITSRL